MKNIQIIDCARNATFSIFQASNEAFDAIFPDGRDMELVEDLIARLGEDQADMILSPLWDRPVLKRDAQGIHGTLFYEYADRRDIFPATMREIDWDASFVNTAQRRLFQSHR